MTYKDQQVVKWSSVIMHATKKYTIKNKESWCAIKKSVTSIFFSTWSDLFYYYNYSYKYRIIYQQTCKY